MSLTELTKEKQDVLPWVMESDRAYLAWRAQKLDNFSRALNLAPVFIEDLSNPTESEQAELIERCAKTNLARYETSQKPTDEYSVRADLRGFADTLGLRIAEKHRSAGEYGVVALKVTDAERQRGYIPYSRKPMNWHTDGYYNAPEDQIRAMVLHCFSPASDGGENQFIDPEIAYIRLRDENPDHIRALMHPQAMTIPENREPDGSVRPASVGPVFLIDADGKLAMRYTARTRSITWRDDPMTKDAVNALVKILNGNDQLMLTGRLDAGQGILCNNVLHNRTGFDPDPKNQSARVIFRVRFHNRVKGS